MIPYHFTIPLRRKRKKTTKKFKLIQEPLEAVLGSADDHILYTLTVTTINTISTSKLFRKIIIFLQKSGGCLIVTMTQHSQDRVWFIRAPLVGC